MNIKFELKDDGELFYEIGDWANHLLLDRLVTNFNDLSRLDQDVIAATVIRYVSQGINGVNDQEDTHNIYNRFVELTG